MRKKETRREGGAWVRQDQNAVVILNKKGELVGTRITGLIPVELRGKGYGKLVSMSEYIV
jgi:ribosomal protein L14